MRYINLKNLKKHVISRALPLFLAVLMVLPSAPLTGISAGEDAGKDIAQNGQSTLEYDYDTLKITQDGEEISSLSIYPYEKIEISGVGVPENATYQWQIKHPEKNNLWVDIYDAKSENIGVSVALINNMLAENGTAKLRLRAYTEDYAYLSNTLTVKILEENQTESEPTLSVDKITFPHAMAGETSETPEFVTVTIEYKLYSYVNRDDVFVLESFGEAFTPYVATLKSGTDLDTTVTCPTIVGYQAYLVDGNTKTACSSVVIDLTALKADVKYTVEYHPTNVDYEVRYFFQNIYDDQYVEDKSIVTATGTGISTYPVVASGTTGLRPDTTYTQKTFSGFTSLYYEPETIAADGSTVFHVYYERNYYLMEFDCAGGYGTDTLYVRYGTYISVPNPVRSGWNFAGWDMVASDNPDDAGMLGVDGDGDGRKDGDKTADALPATMPAYNTAHSALWTRGDTTFTVIYWVQNANDDGYSYVASYDKVAGKTGDIVSITTAAGVKNISEYTYIENDVEKYFLTDCPDASLKDFVTLNTAKTTNVTLEGDGSSNFNIYYDRKQYTLKFYYAMSSETDEYYVIGGSTHYFGSLGNGIGDEDDEIALIDRYFNKSTTDLGKEIAKQKGTVNEPTLNALGQSRLNSKKYTQGSVTSDATGYNYHYISFQAKYGADISDLWPCAVFNSVDIKYATSRNDFTTATVSAWNGEYWVKYTRDGTVNNGNQTIKGKYELLDENLLWWGYTKDGNTVYADSNNEVAFLCFWENGADIDWSIPELYRYNIYLECAEGVEYTGKTIIEKNGVSYYLADSYDTCDDSAVAQQTQPSLTGYTAIQYINGINKFESSTLTDYNTDLYSEGYDVNFYYQMNRTNHLTLDNYGSKCYEAIQPYSTPIKSIIEDTGTPSYPGTLEPGAYEFVGWYTGPKGTGFKIVFDDTKNADEKDVANSIWYNPTMPDDSFILFAFWKPVIRNVYFYYDYSDYVAKKYWYPSGVDDEDKDDYYPIKVPHGSLVGTSYSNIPTAKEGYEFVGWFYIDETGKKRFAPDSMEVKQDLHLFAEWQSGIDTQFTVTYKLKNEAEIDDVTYPAGTEIAAPAAGHLTAGKTKTFNAKVGNDLLPKFRTASLFPTVNSHSILMEEEETENTFEFQYVYDKEVWYKVKYLDKITGDVLHPEKIASSTQAIVTEKFLYKENYIPESYYIRKVLASDGEEGSSSNVSELNEIIFYYTPDTLNGIYVIEYYTQIAGTAGNITDASHWKLEQSVIDTQALATPELNVIIEKDKFNGFEYKQATVTTYTDGGDKSVANYGDTATQVTGKVNKNGLEIRIYYTRKNYEYSIRFVEYGNPSNILGYGKAGSNEVFDAEPTVSAEYESEIAYTAPGTIKDGEITYNFYTTVAAPQEQTQTMSIRDSATANEMVFYYRAKTVSINYQAVCKIPGAVDYGNVSLNFEQAVTAANISGSNAIAGDGYEFVGWYTDSACLDEHKVPESWRFIPGDKVNPNDVQNDNGTKLKPQTLTTEDSVTYYALFVPKSSTLMITNNVGTGITDTFLFHIQGYGKFAYIDYTISIQGHGSVTIENIPQGEYTVTRLDWAWEYDCASNSKTLTIGSTQATAEFTNTANDKNWLNGEASKENQFD